MWSDNHLATMQNIINDTKIVNYRVMKFVVGDSSTTAVNLLMWYNYATFKIREGDNVMMPIINIVISYMIF